MMQQAKKFSIEYSRQKLLAISFYCTVYCMYIHAVFNGPYIMCCIFAFIT